MDRNAPISIAAGVLVSVIGIFALLTMPLIIGLLTAQLGFSIQQANNVIIAEVAGGALASITAMFWIQRISWRKAVVGAICVVVVGNLLSTFQTDPTIFIVLRFLIGFLGQGVAFALGIAIIHGTSDADRNFGFVIASQVAFGVLSLLILPRLVESSGSVGGFYVPLAVLAASCLVFVRHVPVGPASHGEAGSGVAKVSLTNPITGLVVMVIWCTGLGAIWAFVQAIGQIGGLEATAASDAIALSTFIAISGALAAAALAGKLGRLVPVSIALIVQLIVVFLLQGQMSWVEFAVKAAVFQTFWNLTGPFIMGAIATADSTGRVSVLIPAAQTSGFFVGPAIVGPLVSEQSVIAANYTAIICFLIALIIFVPLALRLGKESA